VSDVHITVNTNSVNNSRDLTKSILYLKRAVKELNSSDSSFVVFSGDVVQRANKYPLVMFAKIINDLNKPYYVIPGNHDLEKFSGIDNKEFFRLMNKFSHNKTRRAPAVIRKSGKTVFIVMNSVNELIPGSKGYFKESELMWLDKKLNKYKNKNVVIIQHYPLIEPYKNETHKTYESESYLKLLQQHKNVIAIISGHYHADNEIKQDGIMHISVPSLAQDGEYKEIEIENDFYNREEYTIKTKIRDVK
jgi:3',5'-cyclic AMP phosphodiesterase CpdA